ncbi:hypothetical protein LBMAG42_24050 [Deltaproteobacteria bacterium]|nr:hypothetical protein LBMAG42_24050 [Deltaproteobacteria bacterium]
MNPENVSPDLRLAVGKGLFGAAVLLVVAAALGAAVVVVGGHGEEVRRLWTGLDGGHLALAWLVMTSGMVGLALRWRAFFPAGVRADLAPLTSILFVGMLLNYALPGPVGELVGASLAARRFGIRTEAALAAGLTARFIGLGVAGLVALILVMSGWVPLPEGAGPWIRVATVMIAGGACVLAFLAAFPGRLEQAADATVGRAAEVRGLGWLRPVHSAAVRFAHALGALGRVGVKPYVRAIFWAFVGHALVIFGVWIAGHGLGQAPAVPGLVFTYAASTAGAVALFAMPGGQVGWDAMFASLLVSSAGMDVSSALALTLAVRLQQLTLVFLGGIALVVWLRNGTAQPAG